MYSCSLHIASHLVSLEKPIVMAIINATPDSFFAYSRCTNDVQLMNLTEKALEDGASILDVGAYSTRPGRENVSAEEEWNRLSSALKSIRAHYPDAILSVDTFRADIAYRVVSEYGVNMINDISAGRYDESMFDTISRLQVPYILTFCTEAEKSLRATMMNQISRDLDRLSQMGVHDVVLDPGFGFAKTPVDNFALLNHLDDLQTFNRPVLVGISRKSMLYHTLNIMPDEALNATTAAHMVALMRGANILRVHDVRPAIETITLYNQITAI